VAYFSSIALLGLAAVQPASPDGDGDTTTYFDSVVYFTVFLLAGEQDSRQLLSTIDIAVGDWLGMYGKARAADAISSLQTLFPSEASLLIPDSPKDEIHTDVNDGEKCHMTDDIVISRVEKIQANLLEVGDIVRVENGSTPPADGRIQRGETIFDESSLTGESALIKKYVGDPVALGTINKGDAIDIQITAIGEGTMSVLLTLRIFHKILTNPS
jgi:Cu+-exporting ATPase